MSIRPLIEGGGSLDRDCYIKLINEFEYHINRYDGGGPVERGLECDGSLLDGPEGTHPFDAVEWTRRPVEIRDESGRVVFSEPAAEFPASWDDRACVIVAQKYFHGDHEQGFRETSLRQLLLRVSLRIGLWAIHNRTFSTAWDVVRFVESLIAIQLRQEFAFNSPVYFNVGIDIYEPTPSRENYRWSTGLDCVVQCEDANTCPQISACFIQAVSDDMPSIMRLATSEALVFKRGSGTGTDLSPLRSHREKLSGGGKPSGPLSFMRIYDAIAGVVQSGGKTRRAAKMQTLKIDHPDIMEFINAKAHEERKARALIAAGYEANFNGEAYRSVFFQNCNMSVRVTDAFMFHCGLAEPSARQVATIARTTGVVVEMLDSGAVMDRIAENAHSCGDPGLQFEDEIRRWHTVPAHGPINSSNPCSEYMHIDDSACNLASINMMRCRRPDRTLNVPKFTSIVDVITVAMETMVDAGSYPTPEIALNSHRFRPLGGGYANVGAYATARGWPYDSDVARNWVASLTSLLTARMYRRSAELAARHGAFDGFAEDRDAMLNVINMHWDATRKIPTIGIDEGLRMEAICGWADAHAMGSIHGFRNSQASCIAPTGTIAFMMGCDTLGIEPEIALVRYKSLAGRGVLRLVSRVVPEALDSLGYEKTSIDQIISHIEKYGTIQDVDILDPAGGINMHVRSGLRSTHLPVFDSAFPPQSVGMLPDGTVWRLADAPRSIAPEGHVDMMAAATCMVSGAISKTVNMPEDATVEDIKNIYMRAWKGPRGRCKAIAVYRDGSKGSQPITTAAPVSDAEKDRRLRDLDRAIETFPNLITKVDFPDNSTDQLIGQLHDSIEAANPPKVWSPGRGLETSVADNGPGAASGQEIPIKEIVDIEYENTPKRRKLGVTRNSVTHKFSVAGHEGYITVGLFGDTMEPGEVFINMSKNGSTIGGLMDALGVAVSLGLQYGVPLEKFVEKFSGHRFPPSGVTGDPDIPFATSIIDCIGRWLGCYFIEGYRETIRPVRSDNVTPAAPHGPDAMDDDFLYPTTTEVSGTVAVQFHGNPCPNCGSIMIRQGMCEQCFACGYADGGCGG